MANLETNRSYLQRRVRPGQTYADMVDFPAYFEIETVNTCNARCPMCTIEQWTRKSPTMKDPLFNKIAEEICENADCVKRVSLYRDGEPLLDKKLPGRIRTLKDGGVRRVGISTNISLLNERRGRAILEAGIDEVIMSMDSLKKDVFEKYRAGLSFEECLDNLHRYIELRNEINPRSQVWVRMVRQTENADEWPEYQRYWSRFLTEVDRCNYSNVHNWGGQADGVEAVAPTYQFNLPCIALWSLMVIFANGDVPLCNVDFNNKHPSGDVRDHSIREVWTSAVMERRRAMHLDGRKSAIPMCTHCNVWDEPPDLESVSSEYAEAIAI